MNRDDAPWIEPEELAAMPADDPYPRSAHRSWQEMFLAAVQDDDGPTALWALACQAGDPDTSSGIRVLILPDSISVLTAQAVAACMDRHHCDPFPPTSPAVVEAVVERHPELDALAAQGPSTALRDTFRFAGPPRPWFAIVARHFGGTAWTTADGPVVHAFCREIATDIGCTAGYQELWAEATADLMRGLGQPRIEPNGEPNAWRDLSAEQAIAAIDAGVDVAQYDHGEESLLSTAIERGDIGVVEHALRSGFDPARPIAYCPNVEGDVDALYVAMGSHMRSVEMVSLILDAGIDPYAWIVGDDADGHAADPILIWRDRLAAAGPSARLGLLVAQAARWDSESHGRDEPSDRLERLVAVIVAGTRLPSWQQATPEDMAAFRREAMAAMDHVVAAIAEPGGMARMAALSAVIDLDDHVQAAADAAHARLDADAAALVAREQASVPEPARAQAAVRTR